MSYLRILPWGETEAGSIHTYEEEEPAPVVVAAVELEVVVLTIVGLRGDSIAYKNGD